MSITATNASMTTDVIPPFSLDIHTLANGQFLIYNSTTEKFENKTYGSGGESFVTTIDSATPGESLFKEKDGDTITLKGIVGGTGIDVSQDANSITIAIANSGGVAIESVENVGGGAGESFAELDGTQIELRTIAAHADSINLTVATNGDLIELTNSAEINTASNLGSGEGVFYQKVDEDLEFKSIVAGDNISISSDNDEITISSSSGADIAKNFQFRVDFDAGGNLDSYTSLPTDWTAEIDGAILTITHNVNKELRQISYQGYDATDDNYTVRYPTPGYPCTVPATGTDNAPSVTVFKLNLNTTVTGADLGGFALVNVVF